MDAPGFRSVEKPQVKCSACANQAFIAVDEMWIERHLRGTAPNGTPFVRGVYPMLADDMCWLLAADFDEGDWRRDVSAFAESCRHHDIPVAVERSRSGNGAHAWIFFEEPLPAALARGLGAFLITETMERVPDVGFRSYDRFFPSQDTMPTGGFGNLIALPLQGHSRGSGNSVFGAVGKARSSAARSQRGLVRFPKPRNASSPRPDAILAKVSTVPALIPYS